MFKKIRKDLKELREEIKAAKVKRQDQSGMTYVEISSLDRSVFELKRKYRIRHILYCLLRGKSYRQIENSTREGNEVSLSLIKVLLLNYLELEADFSLLPDEQFEGLQKW